MSDKITKQTTENWKIFSSSVSENKQEMQEKTAQGLWKVLCERSLFFDNGSTSQLLRFGGAVPTGASGGSERLLVGGRRFGLRGGGGWWAQAADRQEGVGGGFTVFVDENAVFAGTSDEKCEYWYVGHQQNDNPPGEGHVEHVLSYHLVQTQQVSVFLAKVFGVVQSQLRVLVADVKEIVHEVEGASQVDGQQQPAHSLSRLQWSTGRATHFTKLWNRASITAPFSRFTRIDSFKQCGRLETVLIEHLIEDKSIEIYKYIIKLHALRSHGWKTACVYLLLSHPQLICCGGSKTPKMIDKPKSYHNACTCTLTTFHFSKYNTEELLLIQNGTGSEQKWEKRSFCRMKLG